MLWHPATCPSGLRGLIANQFVSGSNPLVAFITQIRRASMIGKLQFSGLFGDISLSNRRLGRVVRHLIANQVTAVRLR